MSVKTFIDSRKSFVRQLRQALFGPRWFPISEIADRQARLPNWDQESLRRCKLAVVGCGSLGANFGIYAARAGVGEIWCFDHDWVEVSNLSRQPYFYPDVGIRKAHALKNYMRRAQIDRQTRVDALPIRFEEAATAGELPTPDMLFVGVDNDPSRRWISRYATLNGIPAIFTGLDGAAAEGYVFVQKSQIDTPCPACFWPSLAESNAHIACAPLSSAIALTIVGISLGAFERLVMGQSLEWDAKTVSIQGNVEGNYRVRKRPNCRLCGPEGQSALLPSHHQQDGNANEYR